MLLQLFYTWSESIEKIKSFYVKIGRMQKGFGAKIRQKLVVSGAEMYHFSNIALQKLLII